MSTIIHQYINELQSIIVDDIRASYFKSVLSKGKNTYIPFENEEVLEHDPELVLKLDLLLNCRFEFDLNFVRNEIELQTFFNEQIRNDITNTKIRTILNWVNAFYVRVGNKNWTNIADEISEVYSLNSNLQMTIKKCCYDDFILTGGTIFQEKGNTGLAFNNPWLIIVGLIKFIPATVIISLTQVETMDKWQ